MLMRELHRDAAERCVCVRVGLNMLTAVSLRACHTKPEAVFFNYRILFSSSLLFEMFPSLDG